MPVQDTFKIDNGVLTAYTGPDTEIKIPEGVYKIADGVFKGMSWLTSVRLPETLRIIGAFAFKGCRKIRKINFPEGLTEIGEYAFHRCHCIEEMIFPLSLTKVDRDAFLYCDGLKRVVIESPKQLGRASFSHNMSLNEIALNKNLDISNFAEEVFEGCVRLHKITLSGETYEVPNLIEALKSDTDYPPIIKAIAKSAYHSLQIEDGVLQSFNINLKNISLPEGISEIGKGCFFDKKGIFKITLPKSVYRIRANAFLNCINLEEVTIQNEKVSLDGKAFRGCCNLKKIILSCITYNLADETSNELVSRIREQVLGDFYISGRVLVRYIGNEEQIQIPNEVEIIGERCFFGNERLKSVTCPENLSEIREQAFEGCLTLQTILLSGKLKRIEREAFAECKKLLKINLPEDIEFIGEYAFRRCFSLPYFDPWPQMANIDPYAFYLAKYFPPVSKNQKNFKTASELVNEINTAELPMKECESILPYSNTKNETIKVLNISGINRIGSYAYASCPNLEEIYIDAPECVIETRAFSNCQNLKKIHLKVKKIEEGAFSYCRMLEEVSISGVNILPAQCFSGCYSLKKFEAKELIQMNARCFDECINLNSFDFSGIKKIGERAFERCDSLREIKLRKIECGYHAFADCANLETVEISKDTILKSGAFIGCTQIKYIVFEDNKYEFTRFSDSLNRIDNHLPGNVRELIASVFSCFDIQELKKISRYSQDSVKVTIPQDIDEIGQDVFRDHERLKEITIPESVNIFGSHAFAQTLWLKEQQEKSEMVIVNNVLIDGSSCKGKVDIPLSVKKIFGWCFAGNTDITELTIPSERITIEALSFRNCINLKRIIDWNKNEYTLNCVSDLNDSDFPELILRIFSECINCFKLDNNMNLVESTGNITNLKFPEGIRSVGDGVYKDCHLLENIFLCKDTERIGKSAFENSKWLKSVSKAQSVVSIGAMAFSGCQSLERIDISNNLTEMGNRCFEHCCSLSEISISDKLEKIPEKAFFRCKSLKKIYIPKSVKVIEPEAFAFCDNLEEVSIANETSISDKAFAFSDKVRILRY